MNDDRRFSDDEAAAALKRAAQLQVEAAERVEHATDGDALRRQGFARQELVEAAREAGIDARYVALALREQESLETPEARTKLQTSDATLMRWLGTRRRSISVSRVIEAEGAAVLEACCQTFESQEFGLSLAGTSDAHPLDGGMLEFKMPRLRDVVAFKSSYTELALRLEQLEMWTLWVTFRPHGERTEIIVQGDLRPGAHANLRFAQWSTGVSGVLGAVAGSGAAIGAGLVASLAFLPGLMGAAIVGGLVVGGYRAMYRSVLRKTEVVLETLLQAVATRISRRELLAGERPALGPSEG